MVPIAGRIMRLTKKAAALLVAAAMVMSMGTTVFAGDDDVNKGTNAENSTAPTTIVEYTVTAAYEWTVPKNINFTGVTEDTSNNTRTATVNVASKDYSKVSVTKNVIAAGHKLQITVGSDEKTGDDNKTFAIATSETGGKNKVLLNYTIQTKDSDNSGATYGTALGVDDPVIEVPAGTNAKAVDLQFVLTKDSVEKAGKYTGTLTYTAAVVENDK